MTACPHCTKEIADAALDADWVKRSAIKGRLDEAGQNAVAMSALTDSGDHTLFTSSLVEK